MSSVLAPAAAPAATIRPSTTHRSFIEDLTIEHGPADLLGRFFLTADAACRERGVTLSFGTFEEVVAANEANRDSWKPLFPAYHPAYHNFTDDNSFALIGRDGTGQVVVTQVGILFRLGEKSFHDFATELRINYDDPDRMKQPGEACKPTAPSLKSMKGNVLFGGATWFHPSVRKAGFAEITPRISRAFGYTRFRTDYSTAFIVAGPLKGGLGDRAGYPHVDWGVDFENSPMGSFSCAFCWMEPDYLLNDLRDWLGRSAPAEVDAGVRERRA